MTTRQVVLRYDENARLVIRSTVITGPRGAPGSTTFAALTDVDVDDAEDGNVLVYDEDSGRWVAAEPTVERPQPPGSIRLVTGRYHYLAPNAAGTMLGVAGWCILVPFDLDGPGEVDSLTVEVTVNGHAESLLRLGIYSDDGTGAWGDELMVDAGTVSGFGTGMKTATFDPVALTPGRWWVAVAFQGTVSPSPTLRQASAGPYAGRVLPSLSMINAVAYTSGVTGALPETIGSPASTTACPHVAITGSPLS